uniref:Uncharacterized protein n=1 Tax=Panagrolaimus davidi TaxID=227884 RepID=A0A914QB55_9BILA
MLVISFSWISGVVEKKDDKTAGKPGTSAKTAHQLQSDNDSVSQKENQDPKSKADRYKKTPTPSSSTTADSSSTSNSTSRLSRKRGVNGKEKDSKSSASLAGSSSTSEAATSGPTTHTSLLHEEIDGKFHFTKIAETSWNPFKKIVSDLMLPFGDRPPLEKNSQLKNAKTVWNQLRNVVGDEIQGIQDAFENQCEIDSKEIEDGNKVQDFLYEVCLNIPKVPESSSSDSHTGSKSKSNKNADDTFQPDDDDEKEDDDIANGSGKEFT